MRIRLRDMPDKQELASIYAKPHQHAQWADHRVRVDVTTILAQNLLKAGGRVADLSCGDAEIATRLHRSHNAFLALGDYAPGYEYCGPIEETIHQLPWKADMFILSETLEHLGDPDAVLRDVRKNTDMLVLSTPDGEDNDYNPEHVWSWTPEDIEDMLTGAGFTPRVYNSLDLRPAGFVYCYQIWIAT
jgi:hypothetical protein